jgi:ETFB lysine methyltransferase
VSARKSRAGGAPDPEAARIAELRRALERRFRTALTNVRVLDEELTLVHPANADELISEEDFVRDERLPYWADIWPSSLVLAEHVRRGEGTGRRLLELGCGIGLVATAAAQAGFAVTASDYYEDALDFTRVNVAENARRTVETRLVDWRSLPPDLGRFNVVVASDVLYEPRYGPLIASVLDATLTTGGVGFVADPGRIAAEAFVAECAPLGLSARSGEPIECAVGEAVQKIRIYEIRREVR